jgi:hypothetical protein
VIKPSVRSERKTTGLSKRKPTIPRVAVNIIVPTAHVLREKDMRSNRIPKNTQQNLYESMEARNTLDGCLGYKLLIAIFEKCI